MKIKNIYDQPEFKDRYLVVLTRKAFWINRKGEFITGNLCVSMDPEGNWECGACHERWESSKESISFEDLPEIVKACLTKVMNRLLETKF